MKKIIFVLVAIGIFDKAIVIIQMKKIPPLAGVLFLLLACHEFGNQAFAQCNLFF